MAKLENWAVVNTNSPYTAPELKSLSFVGNVYGHGKFKDGERIVTSTVVKFDNEIFTTYSGMQYCLGEVDPSYEAMFPNAFERVIKAAKAGLPK